MIDCGEAFGGERKIASGEHSELCYALHAEMDALFKVPPTVSIDECYTTFDPCLQCLKHLVYRGCQKFYTLKRASKDWNSPERELFIKTYIPGGRQK